ncbi:MAG: triphosphoribosyl-dephospho-CoA synthase MdcB [Rhizobacter sp.]|nr:triphosphoribosyl-dephospho-CoA synthase MdcB [Rhizobacter sp.]
MLTLATASSSLPQGRDGAATQRRSVQPGRAAIVALYEELALHPKPGLVSFIDSGSHRDMHASTFLRSLFALRGYFRQAADLGAAGVAFEPLEALGIAAEARMLRATGGINTHRGAVFTLGLLCASAGALDAAGVDRTTVALRRTLLASWGQSLTERAKRVRDSNGSRAARQHGLRAAGDEAALGFPTLFEHVLPALRNARAAGADERRARLQALFAAMGTLDDTNLVHRGGIEGLRFAQAAARAYLADGGALHPQGFARARTLHRAFIARRLSPGGAADLLAAACWLDRVCGSP